MNTSQSPTIDELLTGAGDAMLKRAEEWSSEHDDCPLDRVPPAALVQAAIDSLLAHTQKHPYQPQPELELKPDEPVPPPPPSGNETKSEGGTGA